MDDEPAVDIALHADPESLHILNAPSSVKPASLQQSGNHYVNPPPSDGQGRPSFDSFHSSSPSTDSPPTPSGLTTRLDTGTALPNDPKARDEEIRRRRAQVLVLRDPLSPTENAAPLANSLPRSFPGSDMGTLTLRRLGRRKMRPTLGVTTFDAATNNMIDASPLSPVVASPRSIQHQTVSAAPTRNPTAQNTTFPLASPDVSLDFATLELPVDLGRSTVRDDGTTRFSNPFGTSHVSRNDQHVKAPSEHRDDKVQLQYKPRKRVPTPRRLSFDRRETPPPMTGPSFDGKAAKQVQADDSTGSSHRMSSLLPAKGRGISTLRRLTALWGPQSSPGHQAGQPPAFVESNVYVAQGSDGGHTPKRSSMGRRLSNILPFSRRTSFPHDDVNWDPEAEDNDIHTTAMLHGHTSRPQPPPFAVSGIPVNVQRHSESRLSTITIRSSDGWYSTIPADEAQPRPLKSIHHATTSRPINASKSSLQQLTPITRTSTPSVSHDGHEDPQRTFISLSTPPSPITMSLPGQRSRPHSLQNPSFPRVDSLNGTLDHDGSVRLLDVRDAAALRRSIDFDDRVRKSENVLRRALYGSDNVAVRSPSNTPVSFIRSGHRSRSVSSGRGSVSFYNTHRIRTGEISKPYSGISNGGGVFLSTAMSSSPSTTRPSPLRSNPIPGDILKDIPYTQALSSPLEDAVPVNAQLNGLIEEQSGPVDQTRLANPIAEPRTALPPPRYPKFARRLGRRISRIFVGNE
ncbi:hypothetical protein FRC18_006846 [Serendipita sp. 400]|nr:hypothetical protein FRC18_006846 [Serendipita sp. 400]